MIEKEVGVDAITAIESHFHALIRRVVTSMAGATLPNVLPHLDRESGQSEPRWFPVPGMYGGFSWVVHLESDEPVLVVESWSRVVGGSGQRHRITRNGCALESEGFV